MEKESREASVALEFDPATATMDGMSQAVMRLLAEFKKNNVPTGKLCLTVQGKAWQSAVAGRESWPDGKVIAARGGCIRPGLFVNEGDDWPKG